jgi:hypothetical protein
VEVLFVSQRCLAFSLAVLPLLLALSLSGDTIELKTGERIEGAFKQANSAGAVIEVAGQPITIPLEKIQAIYFGAVPARTVAGPAPSQEALDAVRALRSVTVSGISYRDYAPRVLDARVKVDRYLSSPAKDPAQNAIGLAMRYYELAGESWSGQVGLMIGVEQAIGGDPTLQACTALKAIQLPKRIGLAAYLASRPSVLWSCASDQVADAERLITQH